MKGIFTYKSAEIPLEPLKKEGENMLCLDTKPRIP